MLGNGRGTYLLGLVTGLGVALAVPWLTTGALPASGVAAQGLRVYAQNTIQIGTIGIAQVAEPALAVVWSYLLLAAVINGRQAAGIPIVIGGLLGFVVLHQRRSGRAP